MEYADGSDRNLNKEDGLRQESIGRMMGRAYNRSLASIDLPNSPRSSSPPSIHTPIRQPRQSVKSLQSAQLEAGVKRSKLSLSIFQQMLVNISMENYIFRRPKKSKNWKGFVQYCSVSLLILLIVFLSVLLAALGTRINSSGYYLTVCLLTFLIVLIIWHPVFIVIVTFLFVEKYKLGKSDADSRVKGWSAQMYTQVQMLDKNKAEALRNVSYKHTYIPVARKYIYRKQCAQITKSQQIGAGALVNEDYRETSVKRVSLFIFIIVVVIIINLQSGSVSERYMQTKFMRQLIEVGREEIELRQVIEYNDFWEHLRSKFHLATHWSLSNKNTTTSFKTVSNVRVRQIRAAAYKGNCTDDFSMLPAQHCHFDIEYVDIEKRQFALTWEKVTLRSIRTGPFSYIQGTPFQTIRHHYPGGGYDAQYSLIDTNPDIIDYLKIRNWVDERTRAVKVEVALFNADTKLLTSIIHVYEFTAVGIFQDTPQVYSFPLFYQPASSVFLRVCILLLFLFTLIFSVKDARDMYYSGLFNYMTSPMAWVNLLERATCFTVIFMFVLEYEIRKTSVESVQDIYFENKDSETFIDFSAVSDVAYNITLLSCIMATIVFLKVIHQTTNIPSLAQFLKLIPPVLRISYLPILTILYFAILAYFIFVEFEEFATYRSATFTITVMMMNLNVVSTLKESYSTLGPMFVTVCMSVLNYIVLNYFIILLNEQYSKICSLSLLLNQGKRHNILHDIIKIVKPPKILEERKRDQVEEEEMVDYVVLPEDAKYSTDILEVLDDTETSSEV